MPLESVEDHLRVLLRAERLSIHLRISIVSFALSGSTHAVASRRLHLTLHIPLQSSFGRDAEAELQHLIQRLNACAWMWNLSREVRQRLATVERLDLAET